MGQAQAAGRAGSGKTAFAAAAAAAGILSRPEPAGTSAEDLLGRVRAAFRESVNGLAVAGEFGAPTRLTSAAGGLFRTKEFSLLGRPAGAKGRRSDDPSMRAKIFLPGTTFNSLYVNMLADPYISVNMKANLGDKSLMQNNGFDPNDPSQRSRPQMLAMALDKSIRPAVVDALLADMHQRSDQIEAAIAKAETTGKIDSAAQAYDYVVLGAGVHDQIFNNVMTNDGSPLKGLTVTETDGIADNFALAGDFFRLNSTNRPTQAGVAPVPGRGNLNELPGGPVQVSDLDANKFPSARALGDAIALNRASGAADVLFRNRGLSVLPRDKADPAVSATWPADYRIELLDQNRRRHYIYANSVVDVTGGGRPDPGIGGAAIDRAFAETARDLMAPTGLWTFENFARRANNTDTPYREFVGKDVVVVGGRDVAKGDSAKVVMEWLLRLAPAEAYGRDVAQMGLVKSIDWVGPSAKDCQDYINNTRVRYAGIAAGFKSDLLKAVDGKLTSIERVPGGRWRLTYKMVDGSTRTKDADTVILATGYKQDTYKRYRGIVKADSFGVAFSERASLQNSDAVEEVRTTVPGVDGTTTVGKKLKGQRIYFAGPNAGKIVDPAEQAGVLENAASIYATGRRTAALAEMIASEKPRGYATLPASKPVDARVARDKASTPVFRRPLPSAPIRAYQPSQGLYLRARLSSVLAQFKFPRALKMKLIFTRLPNGYAMENSVNFDQDGRFAELLNRDPRFVEALASLLNGAQNQLVVDASVARAGKSASFTGMAMRRSAAKTPEKQQGMPAYVFAAAAAPEDARVTSARLQDSLAIETARRDKLKRDLDAANKLRDDVQAERRSFYNKRDQTLAGLKSGLSRANNDKKAEALAQQIKNELKAAEPEYNRRVAQATGLISDLGIQYKNAAARVESIEKELLALRASDDKASDAIPAIPSALGFAIDRAGPASDVTYAAQAPYAKLADDYYVTRARERTNAARVNSPAENDTLALRFLRIVTAPLRLTRFVPKQNPPLAQPRMEKLFLLARAIKQDPDAILADFDRFRTFSVSFIDNNLDPRAAVELFCLAKLSSKDPRTELRDFQDFKTKFESQTPTTPAETKLKLFVLGRLLGRDPMELFGDFGKFEKAVMALQNGTPAKSALPVFFVSRLLGRDPLKFYAEFANTRITSPPNPVTDREKEIFYALGKLSGISPAKLAQEFFALSRYPLIAKTFSEDEKLALFLVPYAQRSQIDAKQAFFIGSDGAPQAAASRRDRGTGVFRAFLGDLASY